MVDGTCSSKSYNVGSLSCPLCICASVDEIAIYQAPLCHNYGTIGFLNVGWMIFEAPQGFHPKSGLERWWQEEASKNYNKNKKRYVCTLSRMCDFIPHQVHQFMHKHAETLLHTKRMWCLASTLHWKVVCYELCVLAYLLGIDDNGNVEVRVEQVIHNLLTSHLTESELLGQFRACGGMKSR